VRAPVSERITYEESITGEHQDILRYLGKNNVCVAAQDYVMKQ
jgi:hypothetical protein